MGKWGQNQNIPSQEHKSIEVNFIIVITMNEETPGVQYMTNDFRLSSLAMRPRFPTQLCLGVLR